MTWFSCELLGENGWEYRKLVLVSNNYTEVSDEIGTLFFFFYDLKGSTMFKNELTMYRSTLLFRQICRALFIAQITGKCADTVWLEQFRKKN